MDGLIVILIIIGIVSRLNKKKKQQEETLKKYRRDNAFAEAFEATAKEAGKAPAAVKKAAAPVKKAAEPVFRTLQQEIPFTKEEWAKFIEAKPAKAAPSGEGFAPAKQPLPEGFSPALKSTQGESEKEHRRHLEKIAAEEKKQQEQAENLREIRSMNRQKLRQAVIMSEVLGKPAALRKK